MLVAADFNLHTFCQTFNKKKVSFRNYVLLPKNRSYVFCYCDDVDLLKQADLTKCMSFPTRMIREITIIFIELEGQKKMNLWGLPIIWPKYFGLRQDFRGIQKRQVMRHWFTHSAEIHIKDISLIEIFWAHVHTIKHYANEINDNDNSFCFCIQFNRAHIKQTYRYIYIV